MGRLVNTHGEPSAHVDLVVEPGFEHTFQTDSRGRFRIVGLVPGLPIRIWVSPMGGYISARITKGQALAAGEIRDLGDVQEEKP